MSDPTAAVWIAGATAFATLAAVGAALWGASAAARAAQAAVDEAQSASRRADEEAARSERIRHEAVRPVLNARAMWTAHDPTLKVEIYNEGAFAALNMRVGLRYGDPSGVSVYAWGEDPFTTLRPIAQLSPANDGRIPPPYIAERSYMQMPLSTCCALICYCDDVLAWPWRFVATFTLGSSIIGIQGISTPTWTWLRFSEIEDHSVDRPPEP